MFMFAILFGLSMDYEVFLLSRVREEYVAHRRQRRVASSTASPSTARVITSAALIMVSVFLASSSGEDPATKMFGLGLATAILVDATLVRMVLVPGHDDAARRRQLVAAGLARPGAAARGRRRRGAPARARAGVRCVSRTPRPRSRRSAAGRAAAASGSALIRPARPASSGTSSATCSATRAGLGVDADDLGLDVRRLVGEQLAELRVGHDLGVVLERGRDLLPSRRPAGPCSRWPWLVKVNDSDGEHDRAGEREAERQAERAAGRVDAGGLADPLLGDRARACSC